MNENQIKELVEELCKKKVTYKDYKGEENNINLVWTGNDTILEQIIRKHLLDNRDEQLGVLEAKVFTYEKIIANSNFAPLIIIDQDKTHTS